MFLFIIINNYGKLILEFIMCFSLIAQGLFIKNLAIFKKEVVEVADEEFIMVKIIFMIERIFIYHLVFFFFSLWNFHNFIPDNFAIRFEMLHIWPIWDPLNTLIILTAKDKTSQNRLFNFAELFELSRSTLLKACLTTFLNALHINTFLTN